MLYGLTVQSTLNLQDTSKEAVDVIYKNAQKLNFKDKIQVMNSDFMKTNTDLSNVNITFIDPPYKKLNYNQILSKLIELHLSGIIVIESDEKVIFDNFKEIQCINTKTVAKKTLYFINLTNNS